jgi:nitrogen PTS system EIIA component
MAQDDFDIEGLARYLHLTAPQVQKMAEREQLPGRKIAGQWRFSPAEVHHWLEERIGASDEGELAAMEDVLHSHHPSEEIIRIADLLPTDAISAELPAKTARSAIDAMIDLAAQTGFLWDPPKMAEAVRARENLFPTALDNGVALLHPRRPMNNILAEPFLALGRTGSGIPFGGARGTLTDIFFLICSVTDSEHLRTLARLSRILSAPGMLGDLRDAADKYEMLDVIRRYESEL